MELDAAIDDLGLRSVHQYLAIAAVFTSSSPRRCLAIASPTKVRTTVASVAHSATSDRIAGLVVQAAALDYRQLVRDRLARRLNKRLGELARTGHGRTIATRYWLDTARHPHVRERWEWLRGELDLMSPVPDQGSPGRD